MQRTHIKTTELYYAGGGHWQNVITLKNGIVIVICDEQIGIYKNQDQRDRLEQAENINEGFFIADMADILKEPDQS